MQRNVTVETDATPERLYFVIADLGTYPQWLDVVTAAEAVQSSGGPVWLVTLRARVGPFARSKQLRVQRVAADGATRARYERRETDNRTHANWVMDARVREIANGRSALDLELSYSGGLWSGPLDAVLGREIDTAVSRLPGYIAERTS